MRKPFLLAYLFYFVALLGCEGPQQGPDPSALAQEHDTDSLALAEVRPSPLSSHVMVYHRALGMVVMFGGSDPNRAPSNTLWGWNGSQWRVLSTDGPLPRLHTGMAYDDHRNRLVLYGGIKNREESFSDTWEWDGRRWEQRAVGGLSPGVRDHHAMVFVPNMGAVLLFGGQDENDAYPGETWAWDGAAWRPVAQAGPEPRSTHRLSYDDDRERVVLFGGWGQDGLLGDTWEWDGQRWTRSEGLNPSPRGAARTAYAHEPGQLVLFGGFVDSEVSREMWVREQGRWREVDAVGPPPRNVHAMAYDPLRQRVVLYGGIGAEGRLGDLWEWDGAQWIEIP